MAFKNYKDLDLAPEKKEEKELKELRRRYGVERETSPRFKKDVNVKK